MRKLTRSEFERVLMPEVFDFDGFTEAEIDNFYLFFILGRQSVKWSSSIIHFPSERAIIQENAKTISEVSQSENNRRGQQ